jgi:uncharacterized protein with HEPN domain
MTASSKLRFLADTVLAEAEHLQTTDGRLFAVAMTPERTAGLRGDIELAERTDAFVARFGRLQDTVADKLLPALLDWLAEPVGPAIDNLNKAERLGWIRSVDAWIEVRRLRNRMIHEYVRDPVELASALSAAHAAVPLLTDAAQAMAARVMVGSEGRDSG